MRSVKKIKKILEEITDVVKGVEECAIVTSDGFNIVSSSSELEKGGINGDLISTAVRSAEKITNFLVSLKSKELIFSFREKEIVIIVLNDHIFLVYLANKDSKRTLILLDLKQRIQLIKNLIKEY